MLMAGPASHVEPGMVQVPEVDRDRLGVAEQERRMRQQQHARQDHRPERVDMLDRIEAHPAKLPGGIVAELIRHEGMRGLVERDGDQEGEDPDRDGVQCDVHVISLS